MISPLLPAFQVIFTILAFLAFVVIDRWVASRTMSILSERSVRRFLATQLRVLVVVGFVTAATWLLTGLNIAGQTLFAYVFALLFSIIMDFAWEFASPYSISTLQQIADRRRQVKPRKQSVLLRLAGLLPLALVIAASAVVLVPLPDPARVKLILLAVVALAFTYFVPEYYLLAWYIGDATLREEDRTTLLFILVRDPLPAFVFLGVLANLWRVTGPGGSFVSPRMQLAWLVLLGLIFLVSLYGLIQYQKGTNQLRRQQEQALDSCIETLDEMDSLVTFSDDSRWRAELDAMIKKHQAAGAEIKPTRQGSFSPKNLYGAAPDSLLPRMLGALQQYSTGAERQVYLQYMHELRKSVVDERKNLKESRPVVFEITVTAVSVISSTILAKLAETIFETIK